MQNIDLIAIGKMNAAYFAQGVAEYQKRLGGFCNFRIIELPEVQIADKNASDKQIAKALQKEGEAILGSVRKGAYLVALCVEGKQVSSEDLAAMIADRAMSGAGDMAFVIGSSHGLDDSVKRAPTGMGRCSSSTRQHGNCHRVFQASNVRLYKANPIKNSPSWSLHLHEGLFIYLLVMQQV